VCKPQFDKHNENVLFLLQTAQRLKSSSL